MLRKVQYNGYIGKAELSKNHKKTKVPFISIFLKKSQLGAQRIVNGQASMLRFLKNLFKNGTFVFLRCPIFGDKIYFSTSMT